MGWSAAERDHLDEAAFVHSQWERALIEGEGPLMWFADGIDERWLAHVEALTRAPAELLGGWFGEALDGALEPGAVNALALSWLATGTPEGQKAVIDALESHAEHAARITRALDLCWVDIGGALVGRLGDARSPTSAAALLRALGRRGRAPTPDVLEAHLVAAEADVRAAAWICAPFADLNRSWVARGLSDPEERVRSAACEAGVTTGDPQALGHARQIVDARCGSLDFAMSALAITGARGDLDRLARASQDPTLRRQAVWALGLSGWHDAASICLQALADAKVADLASEGFEALTGIRVRRLPEAPAAEEEEVGDEPPAPRTRWSAPPPPRPSVYDADGARAQWVRLQQRTRLTGGRIDRGVPLGDASLVAALGREPMRRRHVRGLEIVARSRGACRLDTLGWGWHQVATLRSLSGATGVPVDRPLDALQG